MPVEKPDASIVEVVRAGLDSLALDLHTSMPGIVKSYDDTENTIDVQPAVKRKLEGELEELPVIKGVPVAWFSGGGGMIKLSLEPGDMVWLIFSETSWAKYKSTGQVAAPDDLTRHPLSYPIAYPTARKPVAGAAGPGWFTADAVYVGDPITAQFVALATLVDAKIEAIRTVLNAHVHSGVTPGILSSGPLVTPLGPQTSTASTKLKAT